MIIHSKRDRQLMEKAWADAHKHVLGKQGASFTEEEIERRGEASVNWVKSCLGGDFWANVQVQSPAAGGEDELSIINPEIAGNREPEAEAGWLRRLVMTPFIYLRNLRRNAGSWRPTALYQAFQSPETKTRYEWLVKQSALEKLEYDKNRLRRPLDQFRQRYIEDWGLQDLAKEIENESASVEN